MSFNNFKTEAELRAMNYQELNKRRMDVNVTLSMLRKALHRGYGTLQRGIYHRLKEEKKLILRIMEEKHWQPS